MAKDRMGAFEEIDDDFDAVIAAEKMPTNISRGRQARTDYIELPIHQIVPYQHKQGGDFSRLPSDRMKSLEESIRADGIMEALTVRPLADDLFELLAGETRWTAAKNIGLKTVPCRVVRNCDDKMAERIFSATNLLRRELTVRDKVNGWWHYWESVKKTPGRKKETDLLEEIVSSDSDIETDISMRQVKKYHKIHSLQEPLLEMLDQGGLTVEAAYSLSFLTDDQQLDVCRWKLPVSKNAAEALKKLSQAGEWSEEDVRAIYLETPAKRDPVSLGIDNAMKRLRRVLTRKVSPEVAIRLDSVMSEALELYFEKHPEDRLVDDSQ